MKVQENKTVRRLYPHVPTAGSRAGMNATGETSPTVMRPEETEACRPYFYVSSQWTDMGVQARESRGRVFPLLRERKIFPQC